MTSNSESLPGISRNNFLQSVVVHSYYVSFLSTALQFVLFNFLEINDKDYIAL
jgi:hypothetical protein